MPKKKGINDYLAVNLLELLIRVVAKQFRRNTSVDRNNAIKNPDVEDIVISAQFKLRNLCRQWKAIVERLVAPLVLTCESDGEYPTFEINASSSTFLTTTLALARLQDFPVCSVASFKTLLQSISGIRIYVNFWKDGHYESIVEDALCRITSIITQPCGLYLHLWAHDAEPTAIPLRDFETLHRRFPTLCLEELYFNSERPFNTDPRVAEAERRCVKYFLKQPNGDVFKIHAACFYSSWDFLKE